ncbi:MAG: NAD(P)-binding domain-containing protein, partial [Rudaea sp.]
MTHSTRTRRTFPSTHLTRSSLMNQPPSIGFVGVGLMGHGIAKNLLAKGFPLALRVH